MKGHNYGHRPPEVPEQVLDMGWIVGIRRIQSSAAGRSLWHSHGETTILLCLSGEFVYEFRDAASAVLTADSFLVIPAGLPHRHAQAVDPPGLRLELLITPHSARPGAYGVFSRAALNSLLGALKLRPCVCRPCPAPSLPRLRRLADLSNRPARDWTDCELAEMRLVCSDLLLLCAASRPTDRIDSTQAVIDKATDWMEAHLAEEFRIDDFVAHIGYSRTHVFTLFRRHTGLTPANCLLRMRIKRARKMLESSSLKSCDIGRACGFPSPAAFNAAFRKHCGLSPLAWRARYSQNAVCE